MKALFITADLGGNLPPTLTVADALARRGLDVEIAGLEPGRTPHRGIDYPAALSVSPEQGGKGLRKSRAMLSLVAGRGAESTAAAIVSERAPSITIVDCMLVAPLRGALTAGGRSAVLFHTFGNYWAGAFARGPAGRALALKGLGPLQLWRAADLRLMLTDPELDPGSRSPALRDFTWAGTSEVGVAPVDRGERPRVLVSLSATDWPGMLPVYRQIIAALAELPLDAVVTTGGVDLGGTLDGAPNVDVRDWVPHAGVLPAVDLVIGHGGHSTTMRALAHGLPVLVLPINPISDQRLVGQTIEAAGLGSVLPRSAKAADIRAAVTAILADTELRERAAATGSRLRETPSGGEVAAARIVALLRQSPR